jgi:hypothetical protein
MVRVRMLVCSILVTVAYCLPAMAALTGTLSYYASRAVRGEKQLDEVWNTAKRQEPIAFDEKDKVASAIAHAAKMAADHHTLDKDLERRPAQVRTLWAKYSVTLTILTLLPFLTLGGGLGRRACTMRATWPALTDAWFQKILVAGVISVFFLYTLSPYGVAATTAYRAIGSDLMSGGNDPAFFVGHNPELTHVEAGFLGWYLYLVGYFSYKLSRGDVTSTRIYSVLLNKFLFVYGMGLVLTVALGPQQVLISFLIGFLPLSAISILREVGLHKFDVRADQTAPLMLLPLVSRWDAMRLEEEGIDNVELLATTDLQWLADRMPSPLSVLELWIDTARLLAVLGGERYAKLRGIVMTATEFERQAPDVAFRARLAAKGDVENCDEIVRTLQRLSDTRPRN